MEPSVDREPAPRATRLLRRSAEDRMVGGVCGGLGRFFRIDSTVVRVSFIVLAVVGGSGVLVYLLAWLVIPDERPGDETGHAVGTAGTDNSVLVGTLLIAAGALLLLDRLLPDFRALIGPIALIGIGLGIVIRVRS